MGATNMANTQHIAIVMNLLASIKNQRGQARIIIYMTHVGIKVLSGMSDKTV